MTSRARPPSQGEMFLDVSWNVQEVTNYLKGLTSKVEMLNIPQSAKEQTAQMHGYNHLVISTLDMSPFTEHTEGKHDVYDALASAVLVIETPSEAETVPPDRQDNSEVLAA
ncbi:unnamed protein product [Somion occarium]|uniref:Uncharacterized protein n=1 Tax=Somion occarium TaxID=3059160 RepID=A0ABP1CX17_9APHY